MNHRLTGLAVAAAVALTLPAIVLAHASLVTSDPADGSTIKTPYTLVDTFAEEADPTRSTLTVENAAGVVVATGTVNADDETKITAQLPALPDGTYTVRWTTVTADDNGVERGTYTFNVGTVNATPAPPCVGQDCGSSQGNGGNDVLIAIGIGAVLIVAIAIAVFGGRRR